MGWGGRGGACNGPASAALGIMLLQSLLDSWRSNFSICSHGIIFPQHFHGNSTQCMAREGGAEEGEHDGKWK